MTRHRQISLSMSARLDSSLDKDEEDALAAHMSECAMCQTEWARFQQLDRLLSGSHMRPAPVHLRARVMSRIVRRDEARRGVFGGLTLTLGTVALVLLLVAPAVSILLNAVGIAPVLISGGPAMVATLLPLVEVVGRTAFVLAKTFSIPLAVLGLCGVTLTLAMNGLWIGMIRHTLRSR